ncbi:MULTISPECIES: regulatory protein SipA [unclassified Anabaena]|uniref:regulatory protein SipA n=1 Tax=unclassified Anabaena TaxID=2619674 RepID=UPI0008301558|nr:MULTISPECIES: DUF3148 domain-containing protein [unclassified Anabaena]
MSEEFPIGSKVRLIAQPPYLKTAEPMPMLRPPDIIQVGDEGIVLDRRPGGYWGVRFDKGAFLLDSQYIQSAEQPPVTQEPKTE